MVFDPEERWPIGTDEQEAARIAHLVTQLGGKDVTVEPWATLRDELEWRRTDSKILKGL